jgi:Flp pilus assembly protein TadD
MHSAGETNMAGRQTGAGPWLIKPRGVLAALTATLLLGACAQTAQAPLQSLSQAGDRQNEAEAPGRAKTELEKATEYWGRQYAQNPRDRKAAISYARNLKAGGQKEHALAVLQHASIYNGENRELASEYGRLALDVDQVSLAEKLLAAADDPANPDWRVVSARGTVLAKQGNYKDAIPMFERALALAPEHPSLLNNLALAHAAGGQADAAEALLRRAVKTTDGDARIRQNLALVLGLQGKYDEAKQVAAQDLPSDAAPANVDPLRKTVRLAPQPSDAPATQGKAAEAAPTLRGGANDTAAASGADQWVTQVAQSPAPRR